MQTGKFAIFLAILLECRKQICICYTLLKIEFFQSVAAAIEKKDPSVIVNKDSNTHWKNWVEFDYENSY
nr:hypothetical protein [Bacillus wiedmannii]